MRYGYLILVVLLASVAGCNSQIIQAKASRDVHFYKRAFDASPNQCYYALRWALKINGYSLAKEDLPKGLISTTWKPVTADSHYLPQFGRRDYGATGGYHQLEVRVVPKGSRTQVQVGSRVKAVVSRLESSGIEENKVLAEIGDYLRSKQPKITNTGMME
jgi:hypothetical protein